MLQAELLELGCTIDQQADSVGFIIFWVIPGGTDYVNARSAKRFYSAELRERVEQLEVKYNNPPELAMTVNL